MKMIVSFFSALSVISFQAYAQPDDSDPVMKDSAQELSWLMVSSFATENTGFVTDRNKITDRTDDKASRASPSMRDRRIAVGADDLSGTWLYCQRNAGDNNVLYQQRVIKLTSIDENTVAEALYTPKDLNTWENVWDKPNVLSDANRDDFEANLDKGCEQIWTRADENRWRGYVDPKNCKIFPEKLKKNVLIDGESRLSLTSLKYAELGFSSTGQTLCGCAPREFTTLARQHSSSNSVLEFSEPSDWRRPDPTNLVLMALQAGDVWIELAPQFAPKHVANIRVPMAETYFDNTAIIRSQDNYAVQWGDADADTKSAKSLGNVKAKLDVEFFRELKTLTSFIPRNSRDAYAERVGLVGGFPVAGDQDKRWLTHCYGVLGVGRGMASDSGNGSSLYVVTGHAPATLTAT